MANGRSYEEIDEMTLFDIDLIFEYWRDHPTAGAVLRAVHGVKPPMPERKVLDFGPEYKRIVAERARPSG
jgi:hypothetical protein